MSKPIVNRKALWQLAEQVVATYRALEREVGAAVQIEKPTTELSVSIDFIYYTLHFDNLDASRLETIQKYLQLCGGNTYEFERLGNAAFNETTGELQTGWLPFADRYVDNLPLGVEILENTASHVSGWMEYGSDFVNRKGDTFTQNCEHWFLVLEIHSSIRDFCWTYLYCRSINQLSAPTPVAPPPKKDEASRAVEPSKLWLGKAEDLEVIFEELATVKPPGGGKPLLTDAPQELRKQWVAYWCGERLELPNRPLTVRTKIGSKRKLGWVLNQLNLHHTVTDGTTVATVYRNTFSCWANGSVDTVRTSYLTGDNAVNPPPAPYPELTMNRKGIWWIGRAKS